ncbi:MAG: hypothetical protein K8I04_03640 [Gammaproteobacteria bacterium]|nr:hypothetical protein [Gammaproteobacteria bacterium]
MIGFWLVNLLPPGSPETFELKTPAGSWMLIRSHKFDELVAPIRDNGACGATYSAEFDLPTDSTRDHIKETAFQEILPICFAASFSTGMAVTVRCELPMSEVQIIQLGNHFPRDRGIPGPIPCVASLPEFIALVQTFVARYPSLEPVEKLRLLSHFFIDAMSCWSLENLYLSGSTLLQIIADTEEGSNRPFAQTYATSRQQKSPGFFDYLAGAADRAGIPALSHDVVKIRNSLIHEGTLRHALLPTQADASVPIAEAMNWFDSYIYAILGLGAVPVQRHKARDYEDAINSFSY